MSTAGAIHCRACGGRSERWFARRLPRGVEAAYHRCGVCGHVQTEPPHWLPALQGGVTLRDDVGLVDRSLEAACWALSLAEEAGIGAGEVGIDYGAGPGLTVRMARDHGLCLLHCDPLAQNPFAAGLEAPAPEMLPAVALVTAFGVAEHFPEPRQSFGEIFAFRPRLVLLQTTLYAGQGEEWWAFQDDGRRVAFYTAESLRRLGAEWRYEVASEGDLHLYARDRRDLALVGRVRPGAWEKARRRRDRLGGWTLHDARERAARAD